MRGSGGESCVAGHEGGLDAVGDLQRGQDAAYVGLDGALAHGETGGDVGVGVALGEQGEYVGFAGGEALQSGLGRGDLGLVGGVVAVDEAAGRGGVEHG